MFVRLKGRTSARAPGRQMDRRRDRRAWRSARRHPRKLRPGRFPRRRRRGATLPEPAAIRAGIRTVDRACHRRRPARRNRHGVCSPCRSRLPGTVVETYLRGRGITDSARHRQPALPSALLLPSRGRRADRDLAGDDRGRHRSRRPHHRRASHLARSVRARQGAGRYPAPGDGPSSRARGPFRSRRAT